MKYKAICPQCSELQTRWEFFEPVPGFINKCQHCNTDYKQGKNSLIIGVAIGILMAALLILGWEDVLPFLFVIPAIILIIITSLYVGPYFTKLIIIKDELLTLDKKWFKPLLKWQTFIVLFVFALLASTVYTRYLYIPKLISFYTSKEKSSLTVAYLQKLLFSVFEMYDIFAGLVLSFTIVLIILFTFNYLFYMKVRNKQ